mgnify:CR=1 FL=1
MIYNNCTYIIVDASEVMGMDYSQLLNNSPNGIKHTIDKSKAIVKYKGDKPSFLNSLTEYTHQEILEELKKTEWVTPVPTAVQELLDGL